MAWTLILIWEGAPGVSISTFVCPGEMWMCKRCVRQSLHGSVRGPSEAPRLAGRHLD